jgi:hypothetical protein
VVFRALGKGKKGQFVNLVNGHAVFASTQFLILAKRDSLKSAVVERFWLVALIAKDWFAPVSSIEEMIDGAAIALDRSPIAPRIELVIELLDVGRGIELVFEVRHPVPIPPTRSLVLGTPELCIA